MTAVARHSPKFGLIRFFVSVLLAAILVACSSNDDETGVLATLSAKSGDLEIVLEVPEGAMPSGVAVSDISVVGLDRDEASTDLEGMDSLGSYRLEPAGVEFEEPLRLMVEFADGLKGVVAQIVSGDGTVEALQPEI